MSTVRVASFALALIGQAALWASPMFACACAPNCAERRTATTSPKAGCCVIAAVEASSAETGACCSYSNRGNANRIATRAVATDVCEACGGDGLGGARCGRCCGGADDGPCGCFHGPDFEIASQIARPRAAVAADLPAAFLPAVAAELFAPKTEVLGNICGFLPPSKARIQAVLCVWRK